MHTGGNLDGSMGCFWKMVVHASTIQQRIIDSDFPELFKPDGHQVGNGQSPVISDIMQCGS